MKRLDEGKTIPHQLRVFVVADVQCSSPMTSRLPAMPLAVDRRGHDEPRAVRPQLQDEFRVEQGQALPRRSASSATKPAAAIAHVIQRQQVSIREFATTMTMSGFAQPCERELLVGDEASTVKRS